MNDEIKNCLQVLSEECAEVIKVVSKIQRFGFNSYHPRDPEKKENWEKLSEEYGDIVGSINKLDSLLPNIISWDIVNLYSANKPNKIDKYYKISKELNNE